MDELPVIFLVKVSIAFESSEGNNEYFGGLINFSLLCTTHEFLTFLAKPGIILGEILCLFEELEAVLYFQ